MTVPYVASVTLNEDAPLDPDSFPGNLAFTRDLHLEFDTPVTFFVGENGSGKSTLLEAMAVLARLPISGGSMNESGANHAFTEQSLLANSIRLAFIRQPRDRYFFRAETQGPLRIVARTTPRGSGFYGRPVQAVRRAVVASNVSRRSIPVSDAEPIRRRTYSNGRTGIGAFSATTVDTLGSLAQLRADWDFTNLRRHAFADLADVSGCDDHFV